MNRLGFHRAAPFLAGASFISLAPLTFGRQDPTPSPVSMKYHMARATLSEPTYGLAKIKKIIAGVNTDTMGNAPVAQKTFNKLTNQEKFTYVMLNGENEDQNCDAGMAFVGEEHKIYARIPGPFQQNAWSQRELNFLQSHRALVVRLVRETIKTRQQVGVNLKNAVLQVQAYELIPDMISIFRKQRKDLDIITTCMLLMKNGHFKPFLKSQTFKKLYSNDSTSWTAFVEGNRANQDLEMERATQFYNTKKL